MRTVSEYCTGAEFRARTEACAEALRRTIRPGSVVVQLGGGAGILPLIAVRLGAAKVYVIEPDEIVTVAREMAQANGIENVEFFNARSEEVTLPERADMLAADLSGFPLPSNAGLRAFAHARERFLKPEGVIIPEGDVLSVAVAETPKEYDGLLGVWDIAGVDYSTARFMVANACRKVRVAPDQLLTATAQAAVLDYARNQNGDLRVNVRLDVARTGTAHSLLVWPERRLVDGVSYSNAPHLAAAGGYCQLFFPLLLPVQVENGDSFEVELRAVPTGDDYTWLWNTRAVSRQGVSKAQFRQSTFHSAHPPIDDLRRRADKFVPQLGSGGAIDLAILGLFGKGMSLRQIASEILIRFPSAFPDWKAALNRVATLSAEYSE